MSDKIDIAKRKESVVFSVRVEKDLLDYYDTLAAKSNRSRNELISLALEYAKDKFNITEWICELGRLWNSVFWIYAKSAV